MKIGLILYYILLRIQYKIIFIYLPKILNTFKNIPKIIIM